jgi:hypothetical protein
MHMDEPDFADVATLLANGNDLPKWLIPALAHFSELVGVKHHRTDDDTVERNLLRCAEYLDRWLPMYVGAYAKLGIEDDVPECIDAVMLPLQDLIVFLSKDFLHKGNSQRRVCAAICAEIWRTLHGATQPHSVHLQEACVAYWRTCKQEPRGHNYPQNWLRDLEWALAEDDDFFQSQIEAVADRN